jgi:glycosyltransferase involved in cell wall biosynthesis
MKQTRKYKYSIVIPTFQRANLLENTIKSCLMQTYDNFQLLISNNFSLDNTKEILNKYENNRNVKVIHTTKKLSMPEHWEFMMDYVEGDYVMIIGDDDGVRTDFLNIIDNAIEKTNSNIIKFKGGLYFHNDWPNEERNTFTFDSNCTGGIYEISPDFVINSYCNFTGYEFFPNLLLTVFSMDLFNQAKKVANKMFVGAPDFSCPFLLLVQENAKLCYIDETLAFGGRSKNSNAAYYSEQKDKKSQSERLKEFISELDAEIRFPHHNLLITTAGNFVPAAFSYAKYFYPERLSNYKLDNFELAKIVQSDLAEEYASNRLSFHDKNELLIFKNFVDSLPNNHKNYIKSMPGKFSIKGRILLFGKLIRNKLFKLMNFKKATNDIAWDTTIQLSSIEIHNSFDFTINLINILKKYKRQIIFKSEKFNNFKFIEFIN